LEDKKKIKRMIGMNRELKKLKKLFILDLLITG